MKFAWFTYDCGSWPLVDPYLPFAQALGGRETAQIRVAQELVKLGHQVDFAMPHVGMENGPTIVDGMRWIDPRQFLKMGPHIDGILVSVESFAILEKMTADFVVLQSQCCHFQPSDKPNRTSEPRVGAYFLLSNFQRWSLKNRDPIMNADKAVTMGNAVDTSLYDMITDVERVPGRIIYSSSPDRGLKHIIRIWPRLKERHPEISLRVFYDVESMQGYKWMHELRAEDARTIDEGKHLSGVEYVGAISQADLRREQKAASLLLYPCDCLWETESYCITALEACAARLPMLLSPIDCLEEIYGHVAHFAPMPFRDEVWLNAVSHLLTHPLDLNRYVDAARKLAEDQTWKNVARRWSDFLEHRLKLANDDLDGILALISATEDRRSLVTA